jgi:hypothetical protein
LDVPVATLAYATGDILLHITGPTTYTNITLAHHDWTKRHEDYFEVWKNPKYSDIMLRRTTVTDRGEFGGAFERLPGSGVINGMMTAHIRCTREWTHIPNLDADIWQAQIATRRAAALWI